MRFNFLNAFVLDEATKKKKKIHYLFNLIVFFVFPMEFLNLFYGLIACFELFSDIS